jgi:hypothetical protein
VGGENYRDVPQVPKPEEPTPAPASSASVAIVFDDDPEPEGAAGVVRVRHDSREFERAVVEVQEALKRLMAAQSYAVTESGAKLAGVRVVESLELRINGKTALEAHR